MCATRVTAALTPIGTVHRLDTTGPGDERRLARIACERGARVLAVVGGDGALHHATRGLLDAKASIPLAPFAAGTGNDYVKSLGLPAHDPAAMARIIARGETRRVDLGMVDDVPFLNAAGFGFDVDVLQRMQRRPWLRGTAAYVSAALRSLLTYQGFAVAVDGANERASLMLVCANGACFGGAFRIAPDARVNDGLLDVVDIGSLTPFARPALFVRAMRGTHLNHVSVRHARGASTTMTFRAPPRFEADGELYTAATSRVMVTVRPAALTVVA